MRHTKGEWIKETTISIDGYHIYSRLDDEDVAIVCDKSDNEGEDETEANALLIAAAPELLEGCEALKKLIKEFSQMLVDEDVDIVGKMDELLDIAEVKIERAISKAKGQEGRDKP